MNHIPKERLDDLRVMPSELRAAPPKVGKTFDEASPNEISAETLLSCVKAPYLDQLSQVARERDALASEVLRLKAENATKDELIRSLYQQIDEASSETYPETTASDCSIPCEASDPLGPSRPELNVRDAVEEIQRWMFVEGGHLMGVEDMIEAYGRNVRKLGIPVDRVFIAYLMLHPGLSTYVWRWESQTEGVDGHEIPREIFEKRAQLISRDEPFAILHEGRAKSVRMKSSDPSFPPDCQWFPEQNYQDYLALPIDYRDEFSGAIAWSTKCKGGFTENEIEFLHRSTAALCTVMRLHTNDLVMTTLMSRLEDEVRDRTRELATANDELAIANRRIRQHSAMQLQHFAMMSHEIRTPLNGIVGMTSLLEETELDEDQRETVDMISSSGALLASLVNDVLDFSKLKSGNVDVVLGHTNFRATIQMVIKAVKMKGQGRQVNITVLPEPADLPETIFTDQSRLQQIFFNLLGNAVKFSRAGGSVEIGMQLCAPGIRFSVKDYGRGINKEHLERIFEPFTQETAETQLEYGGTGLGLAITKKLVSALEGSIHVDSALGEWSEFSFVLPLEGPRVGADEGCIHEDATHHSETDEAEDELSCSSSYEDDRVLIADDNTVNRKLLRRVLERLGLKHVDVAVNGKEAVDMSEATEYSIIFMDMQMPVLSGLEATKQIVSRDRPDGSVVPKIVFCTANALDEFREQAREAGAVDFIAKPFTLRKIEALLKKLKAADDP